MFKLVPIFLCLFFNSVIAVLPNLNSTNGDVTSCLADFYKAVYSGKYNCIGNFDFLSNNLTVSHASFKNGKECFLEIAKDKCHQAQYNFIAEKYADFLTVLTTKPENNSTCTTDFYYKYNGMKCGPMVQDIMMRSLAFGIDDVEVNDTRVLDIIDMCHTALECMEPDCFQEKATKGAMRYSCHSVERKNTEFYHCRLKLKHQSPDLSPFKCLHGMNFFDDDEKVQIELWGYNRQCVKEVMKRFCGEEAVKNFDEDAAMVSEELEAIAAIKAGKL